MRGSVLVLCFAVVGILYVTHAQDEFPGDPMILPCGAGCTVGMMMDTVCHPQCMTALCNYDNGACAVSSTQPQAE
eukprot:1693353-Rhodomonas_salina.1